MAYETLQQSINGWREAAEAFRLDGNHATARECARAVRALEIERDTGVAVCACCFKPMH